MNRGLSNRDWAIMSFAWMCELPLSDTIWRYEAMEKRGDDLREYLDMGKRMAAAWEIESQRESSVDGG